MRSLSSLVLLLSAVRAVAARPSGTEWEPVVAMGDEFASGAFNADKWFGVNPMWKGRSLVLFYKVCVVVNDGFLKLHASDSGVIDLLNLPEGYTRVSGFVKSHGTAGFGYFEIEGRG